MNDSCPTCGAPAVDTAAEQKRIDAGVNPSYGWRYMPPVAAAAVAPPEPSAKSYWDARQTIKPEPCNYCGELASVFFSFNVETTPDVCPACFVTAQGFAGEAMDDQNVHSVPETFTEGAIRAAVAHLDLNRIAWAAQRWSSQTDEKFRAALRDELLIAHRLARGVSVHREPEPPPCIDGHSTHVCERCGAQTPASPSQEGRNTE